MIPVLGAWATAQLLARLAGDADPQLAHVLAGVLVLLMLTTIVTWVVESDPAS